MMIRVIFICLFTQFLLTSNSYVANNYTPNDIFAMTRISQIAISSDGKNVAYVIFKSQNTPTGKIWEYSLYLKDPNNKANLLILNSKEKISSPAFSPNNNVIAYLQKGKQFNSIWTDDIKTHQSKKLIEFKNNIASFKYSPDGKAIAFMSEDASIKNKIPAPIDVSKRSRNGRLYLVDLKNPSDIKPITSAHISVSQFFVYPGFDWSPDSQSIVFSYQPQAGDQYSMENKIAMLNIKTSDIKNIAYSEDHNSSQPIYSHDGKYIAFEANSSKSEVEKQYPHLKQNEPSPIRLTQFANNKICIYSISQNKTDCLENTYGGNPVLLGWNTKDQVLVFDPYYHVDGPRIYTLNLNPTVPAKVFSNDNGFIEPLTIALNNSGSNMGFGFETVSSAPQVFMTKTDKYKPEQLTHFENKLSAPLGSMKTIHWKSTDSAEIAGLLMLPANYDPHKKYPLLVSVHGGPMSAWSKRYIGGCDDYETMIDPTTCWQNYLNLGFIIFQPNPRGSDGYGSKFRLANFADLGGSDFHDVMSGVDYLIKEGIADPDHMAIAGWSYGGYLSAWAITQTHRFKAAIEGDGNIDFISFSGTGLLHFAMEYFGNYFWDNDQLYLQRAPIMHTKNITTPLLIFYGQDDPRLPPSQGYEMYNALNLQHKTVKMFLLPEQDHVPTDPNMIEDSVKAIDRWLEKYALQKN